MNFLFFLVIFGLLLRLSLADYVKVNVLESENASSEKQERFLKFDVGKSEIEVDLGISVPFLKAPLFTGGDSLHARKDSLISLNFPGMIIGGFLFVISYILPHVLSTTTKRNSDIESREETNFWTNIERLDNTLSKFGINSSSCFQKSVCWVVEAGKIRKWIDYLLGTWWFKRLTEETTVSKALQSTFSEDSCKAKSEVCSLNAEHVARLINIMATKYASKK